MKHCYLLSAVYSITLSGHEWAYGRIYINYVLWAIDQPTTRAISAVLSWLLLQLIDTTVATIVAAIVAATTAP